MQKTPKILIVDDERFNLNMLNGLLKNDYKIMVAINGEQALKAVNKALPDLILLDINMPGMDGFEVCQKLKHDPLTEAIPVIFISSYSSAADETRGLEIGGADYITKPFNPSVVLSRIKTQIRLKLQADLLTQYAYKDGLTQVLNRRSFDERLSYELQRCSRALSDFSLILIDIDFFKKYNDLYGHQQGDYCLQKIAQTLTSVCRRRSDQVARYGGEEFAMLLPDTNLQGAKAVAEATIKAVGDCQIQHSGGASSQKIVSISLGIAHIKPDQHITSEDVISMADRALYSAKLNGRNRYEVATRG
ncbi:diguanylate cyclase domain-containing protein [Shewanella sp. YIC-542]|uniref:GGDEF domain-containing response regulator n=1 Tax=Shewanella mytili TaxID=3377111 RepID=UPI00398EC035